MISCSRQAGVTRYDPSRNHRCGIRAHGRTEAIFELQSLLWRGPTVPDERAKSPSPALTQVARWVSIVLHPFVTTAVMVSASVARLGSPGDAARSITMVALSAVVPIAVLMLLQVRRGAWENADASNPRERPLLFGVAAAGLLVLIVWLLVTNPQSFLLRGASGTLVMVAVCAVATRWWKVSLHLAFASLAATGLLLLGSPFGWVLAMLLPALIWSRLVLERHRPVEVALGFAIGVATGLAIHLA